MRSAPMAMALLALLPLQLRAQIFNPGSESNGQVSVQIDVTLRDASDAYHPLTDYALALLRATGDSLIMRTDETGSLRLAVAPGAYRVKSNASTAWHGRQYRWDIPVTVRGGMGIVHLTPTNAIASEPTIATAATAATAAVTRTAAQPPQTILGYKDPGTATLFGVLLTGGGQMYTGRTGKGLALLGLSVGSVVAGAAMSSIATCSTVTQADLSGGVPVTTSSCTDARYGPLYAGVGVALASWLYGAFTAGEDARAANAVLTRQARAVPVFERGSRRTALGLAVRF